MVDPLADRDEREQLARGLRQPIDAEHQGVPEGVRRVAPAVEAGRQQLLAVERIAAGALPQPLEQVAVGRGVEDVGELLGQLRATERLEHDAAGARMELELRQLGAQRVAPAQLVGAIGADQEHPLRGQVAGQEGEGRPRRAIGPVQILDDQHDRALLPQRLQQRQQPLEQTRLTARLGGRARPRIGAGQQRRHGLPRGSGEARLLEPGERAQRGDQRQVRQIALVAEVGAVSGQHERTALARPARQLRQQARLADAGLTRHERQRGPAVGRLGDGGLELRELGGAADQPRTRDPRPHHHGFKP